MRRVRASGRRTPARPARRRVLQRHAAEPHLVERRRASDADRDVDLVAGIGQAHRRHAALDHDPEPLGIVREPEVEDLTAARQLGRCRAACASTRRAPRLSSSAGSGSPKVHFAPHAPMPNTTGSRSRPALGQEVLVAEPLDEPGPLQLAEALREQAPGQARQATGQLVEPGRADQHVAQDHAATSARRARPGRARSGSTGRRWDCRPCRSSGRHHRRSPPSALVGGTDPRPGGSTRWTIWVPGRFLGSSP